MDYRAPAERRLLADLCLQPFSPAPATSQAPGYESWDLHNQPKGQQTDLCGAGSEGDIYYQNVYFVKCTVYWHERV